MSEDTLNDLHRMVGHLQGEMDGVKTGVGNIEKTVNSMDGRLRAVEKRAVVGGGASGGIMSVAVMTVKSLFTTG